MGCHALLQGIFPNEGSNLSLTSPASIPLVPLGKPLSEDTRHNQGLRFPSYSIVTLFPNMEAVKLPKSFAQYSKSSSLNPFSDIVSPCLFCAKILL